MISCGKCKNVWSGAGRCHCGTCHKTFSSLGAFDLHQKPKYSVLTGKLCGRPEDTFLVPVQKEYGTLWSYPARVEEEVEDCCEETHYRER